MSRWVWRGPKGTFYRRSKPPFEHKSLRSRRQDSFLVFSKTPGTTTPGRGYGSCGCSRSIPKNSSVRYATTVHMDPGPLNAYVHLHRTRVRIEFTPNGKARSRKRVGSVCTYIPATRNLPLRGMCSTRSVCPPTLVPTIPRGKGRRIPRMGKLGGGVAGKG